MQSTRGRPSFSLPFSGCYWSAFLSSLSRAGQLPRIQEGMPKHDELQPAAARWHGMAFEGARKIAKRGSLLFFQGVKGDPRSGIICQRPTSQICLPHQLRPDPAQCL